MPLFFSFAERPRRTGRTDTASILQQTQTIINKVERIFLAAQPISGVAVIEVGQQGFGQVGVLHQILAAVLPVRLQDSLAEHNAAALKNIDAHRRSQRQPGRVHDAQGAAVRLRSAAQPQEQLPAGGNVRRIAQIRRNVEHFPGAYKLQKTFLTEIEVRGLGAPHLQVFEQGGQGLQRGAGPDKLQGHFLVGEQGERRLVADHGAAALFRKEVVVQRYGFRKVVGIGGELQHRCGVEIFAAERKAQIFDGLAVHDDVGLLALDVHHDGGLGQQQIDRHQRAGAGLGHDVAHDAGFVIQLGQEKERQCAGQDGHAGHPFPGDVAVLGINQQLGQCDGCAVRCRKAFHQHMVQRGVCERREEQRAGIAGQNVVGHQRCHGGGDCAAALYVLLAAAQLAGGFVGDKALAVGEILHPERDLQQVVQLGAQPGIGATYL